jgi:exonuclease VII large subunit
MTDIKKLSKEVNKKIKAFDTKLKTSFILIRQDLDDMQIIIDAMRKYLKKKDIEYENQNSYIIKAQNKIQNEFNNFTEEYTKQKLMTSQINAIRQEVVIRKDLSKIEEKIKSSFAKEVEKYKQETISLKEELKKSNKKIKELEKGITPKKSWFSKN